MKQRFYLDSSIWIDIYEDRKGYQGELLGRFGIRLLGMLVDRKEELVITDLLIEELKQFYTDDEIIGMFNPFQQIIIKILLTAEQSEEGRLLGAERHVPKADAMHAVIARDHNLLLIARDNHFRKLDDISPHHRPEELI